jgi:chromosome condensin MukBEF ATPase and DNA-binding subunit MukB
MPRRKRTSQPLEDAQNRITAIQTIDPELDLGNGVSVSAFNAKIEETRQALEEYNKALSVIDQNGSNVAELERSLSSLSTRMLSGVATLYGRTSSQYEMTNGSKRRRARPAAATESPAVSATA